MKKEEVIRKLEVLAQRVDQAVYLHIDSLWLFGSALYKENPRDLDVVVVYHMMPKDDAEWKEYYHKKVMHLPLCEHYRYSPEIQTSIKLRKGIKNVALTFTTEKNPEEMGMKTKCFALVWSRDKPNVRENLIEAGFEKPLVKKLGVELASLRSQLRNADEENNVMKRIINAIINHFQYLSTKQKLKIAINILATTPKKEVKEKRIREILSSLGLPEEHVIAERRKGHKVNWEFSKEAKEKYCVF